MQVVATEARRQVMAVRANATSGQMSLAQLPRAKQESSQQLGSLTGPDQIYPWICAPPAWLMLT